MALIYEEPLLSREDYFNTWNQEELKKLKKHHKDEVYNEYRTRHIVFNRDNFTCQVENCEFRDSPITLHHYKHRANDGKTSPRNGITVCRAHQKKYHSGKMALKFNDGEHLPSHIRGHTQAHEWYVNGKPRKERAYSPSLRKVNLKEMKELRKQHRELWGIPLKWEEIYVLMKFLFSSFKIAEVGFEPTSSRL